MKKIFKPASLLFNLLCLLVFFIVGMYCAGWVGAGEGQGLAGGAIVLGWGVLFAGIALVASFFFTYHVQHKRIVTCNWILAALLLLGYGYTYFRFRQRDRLQEERNKPYQEAPEATPVSLAEKSIPGSEGSNREIQHTRTGEVSIGMGFFMPDFYENRVLYFYGNQEMEACPANAYDSITFRVNEHDQFEIATAPPWLVPEISKLDYGLLYFKLESVGSHFARVVVNAQNGRTADVSRNAGTLVYWPDFLLSVHSVEFLDGSREEVRVRPFVESGIVGIPFEFMRCVWIKGEWAKVHLLDEGFSIKGQGWIQWRNASKLLVKFNLLS
jgi:hypothetical protein